jgi:hypothetical protein
VILAIDDLVLLVALVAISVGGTAGILYLMRALRDRQSKREHR